MNNLEYKSLPDWELQQGMLFEFKNSMDKEVRLYQYKCKSPNGNFRLIHVASDKEVTLGGISENYRPTTAHDYGVHKGILPLEQPFWTGWAIALDGKKYKVLEVHSNSLCLSINGKQVIEDKKDYEPCFAEVEKQGLPDNYIEEFKKNTALKLAVEPIPRSYILAYGHAGRFEVEAICLRDGNFVVQHSSQAFLNKNDGGFDIVKLKNDSKDYLFSSLEEAVAALHKFYK